MVRKDKIDPARLPSTRFPPFEYLPRSDTFPATIYGLLEKLSKPLSNSEKAFFSALWSEKRYYLAWLPPNLKHPRMLRGLERASRSSRTKVFPRIEIAADLTCSAFPVISRGIPRFIIHQPKLRSENECE